jgi:hypothetical protein
MMANYSQVLQILGLVVVTGQMVTRLTPTKTDDGFLTRAGKLVDVVCDLLKVPNLRKKVAEENPENEPPL